MRHEAACFVNSWYMRPLSRRIAAVLIATLAPLAFDGCVSIRVERSVFDERAATGSLSVAIHEAASDRDARRLATLPALAELVSLEGGRERPVARSMAASWSLDVLPAGRYALRVKKRINRDGDIVELRGTGRKQFAVRAGERTDVAVVLERVPVLWIVLAAVTLVVLVVLSITWAKEGKIPTPPLPPVPNVLPPIAFSAEFVTMHRDGSRATEPAPVDVFPARGSVVAARRVTISFLMSEPLDAGRLGAGAVRALGTLSGEIPGVVSYRPDEQLLRFTPSLDFAKGEDVTVTVDLAELRGASGARGEGRFSTSFHVSR